MRKDKLKKILPIIVLILITLVIAILSYDNPLAKVETGQDSKVFREVVNIMNHGGAPYKDAFDHKGPILYIIDWLGVNASIGNLDGIWIMQCIAIFITVFFTYKILTKVFNLGSLESIILDFVININIVFYLQEGNLTETYALPLITTTLYLILQLNTSNYKKYNFLIGMFMAIVAFLRVNMISIWIVYYLCVLIVCIKNKQIKELWSIIKYAFLGALSITMIVVAYLVITGSLIYCINDYILFNIKYGTAERGKLLRVFKFFIIERNLYIYIAVLISIVIMFIKKEKFIKWFSLSYFLLTLFLIIQPQNTYGHYATILIPTLIIPIAYAYKQIKGLKLKEGSKKTQTIIKNIVIIAIGILLMYMPTKAYCQIYTLVNIKEPNLSDEEKVINYIKENTNENDTILTIGNACNIYTQTDRKPASRYMFQYPIYKHDSRILEQVEKDIETNKPKYLIVVKHHKTYEIENFVSNVVNEKYNKVLNNGRYELYEREVQK